MRRHWHALASATLTGSLCVAASLPALAGAGSALPCSGYWAGEMRGPHGRMLDRAKVEMHSIGSGLRLRDYVVVTSGGDSGSAPRLQLRLARDGSLLPDPDALSIDFSQCDVDAREYAAPDRFVYFKVIPVLDEDPDARPMKKVRVTKYGGDAQHVSRQPQKESWWTHANVVDLDSGKVLKALDAGEAEQLDITTSIDTAWQGIGLGSPRLDDGFSE